MKGKIAVWLTALAATVVFLSGTALAAGKIGIANREITNDYNRLIAYKPF